MKLSAGSSITLKKAIDREHGPEASVVRRYRHALRFSEHPAQDRTLKQYLVQTSIREGMRIIPLLTYKGVEVDVLDETSGMATGSLKAIDGCLAAAFCLFEGSGSVVFESGGNTGSALTRYGGEAGLETFFFCPLDNIDLLDSRLFQRRQAHLVGVAESGRLKEFTAYFAETTGIRHIPEKKWRKAAAMFRGLFILEQLLAGRRYGWLVQAVSAGFGPLGIFDVLTAFRTELGEMPRLLGIQQEANCPMFEAWRSGNAGRGKAVARKRSRLLSRIMYDENPQTYKTYDALRQLLLSTQGELATINEGEFDLYLRSEREYGRVPELLLSEGVAISMNAGEVVEKTGMIALAGTLKAIDAGLVPAGSRVLSCLTSGVSEADESASPDTIVHNEQEVRRYAAAISGGK